MKTLPSATQPASWFRLAVTGSVVRRSLLYALVVGAVLIAINHGDALLRGDVTGGRIWRMVLTAFVPYSVSTLSSVGAIRAMGRPAVTDAAPAPAGAPREPG